MIYGLDLAAANWFQDTAQACKRSDQATLAGEVLGVLALLQWLAGNAEEASTTANSIDAIPDASDVARAFAHHVRGLVTGNVEQLRAAVRLADASSQATGSVAFRAPLVLTMAATSPDEALTCARTAWNLAWISQNPSALASAHLSVGAAHLDKDPHSARSHLEACRVIAADIANRMLAMMTDVLDSMIPVGRPVDGAAAALDAAGRLHDRGARVQASMALLRAAELLATEGDTRTAITLVRTAELNGIVNWNLYGPVLGLTHLDPDEEQTPFSETPPDLDTAIERGVLAVERLRR